MSSSPRVTRPTLDRSQPVRNWSTLFASPSEDGATASAAGDAAGRADRGSLSDVVARSVDLGYRVVDEYIRQGQKAAQRLNERSYPAQAMAGDVQDLAMRLTQYASDFAAVWLQLVQIAGAGNATPFGSAADVGAARAAPATPVDPPAAAPVRRAEPVDATAPATARVRLEVRSAQPTEVAVDIRPEAIRLPLIVHALRATDPDMPRLDDVSFVPGSDVAAACLRIHVPAGQPPGVYNGLLIEEQTSRPAGTVSVTVTD